MKKNEMKTRKLYNCGFKNDIPEKSSPTANVRECLESSRYRQFHEMNQRHQTQNEKQKGIDFEKDIRENRST